jgi:hypothetical protein
VTTAHEHFALQTIDDNYEALERIARSIHILNKKWWVNPETGQPITRNVGEMIALAHSELSEALEGHRKDLMDDHLPARKMLEVELADTIIRVLDLGEGLGLDVAGALADKCVYNHRRADHQLEARLQPHGKKY